MVDLFNRYLKKRFGGSIFFLNYYEEYSTARAYVVGPTYNTAMHHCILYNCTGNNIILYYYIFSFWTQPSPTVMYSPPTHTAPHTVQYCTKNHHHCHHCPHHCQEKQIKSNQVKSKSRSNLFISLPVRVGVRGIFKMFDKFLIETQREASSCCTQGS